MENTLVSARLSRAKKERGVGALSAIGATVSDLINSAFDYVIETNELPSARQGELRRDADFEAFVAESTVHIDWPDDASDYKAAMRRMRVADYEALA